MSSSGSDADAVTRQDVETTVEDGTLPIAGTCMHGWTKCQFCGFDSEGEVRGPACASCGKHRPLTNGRCDPCSARGFEPLAF